MELLFNVGGFLVEDGYFAHLDPSGRRSDIQHRPEQFLGSYDFIATKPYCKVGGIPFFEITHYLNFKLAIF